MNETLYNMNTFVCLYYNSLISRTFWNHAAWYPIKSQRRYSFSFSETFKKTLQSITVPSRIPGDYFAENYYTNLSPAKRDSFMKGIC